jgi:carbon storage regulator CsrA
MLTLTRSIDKPVIVIDIGHGEFVTVRVLGVDRGKVRFGFNAPDRVIVDRLEVFNTKRGLPIDHPEPRSNP